MDGIRQELVKNLVDKKNQGLHYNQVLATQQSLKEPRLINDLMDMMSINDQYAGFAESYINNLPSQGNIDSIVGAIEQNRKDRTQIEFTRGTK